MTYYALFSIKDEHYFIRDTGNNYIWIKDLAQFNLSSMHPSSLMEIDKWINGMSKLEHVQYLGSFTDLNILMGENPEHFI